ncbi:small cell adhesion glycoprotein [Columba livia]|uniref:Small cell adhesion glycoprotein n=1 Tax=Columba livia TaxID=8932 RepID=A0A2I0LMI6_COLLI|nr:small cell adhesion glycoprotein [Columba livia]
MEPGTPVTAMEPGTPVTAMEPGNRSSGLTENQGPEPAEATSGEQGGPEDIATSLASLILSEAIAQAAVVITLVFLTLLTVLVVIVTYLYRNKGTYLTYEAPAEPERALPLEDAPAREKEEYFI